MYMNMTDALDDTLTYNATGLAQLMATRAGAIWAGYSTPWEKLVYTIDVGQRFLMHNTTLGIPAIYQTEGLHGFTNNGTIFPSPLGIAASFNPALLYNISSAISDEAEGLGLTQVFAPVLDMSRELRWGRVEENFGEDPYLFVVFYGLCGRTLMQFSGQVRWATPTSPACRPARAAP
jgi:beta-glucosidase